MPDTSPPGRGCAQATERALANVGVGKTRKGTPWLRTALVEAAHAATHWTDCYLAAHYHRLVLRRGGKKATRAVGHTLLVIVYHVLADEQDYQELGGNYCDDSDRQAVKTRLVHRLEKLGYEVALTPTSPAACYFRDKKFEPE